MENTQALAALLASQIGIRPGQALAAIELLDGGASVPFIARYRKEATGSLDDGQLRRLEERLSYLRNLAQRREQIRQAIEERGQWTEDLAKVLEAASTLAALEDIYAPYKQKRRTRGGMAREKGLEPLALWIWQGQGGESLEQAWERLAPGETDLCLEEALAGARDIMAEWVSEDAAAREYLRGWGWRRGEIRSKAKPQADLGVFAAYGDFTEAISKVAGHRVLAMNRGEAQKVLQLGLYWPREEALGYLWGRFVRRPGHPGEGQLREAVEDGWDRLLEPVIERQLRAMLTQAAQEGAISVFGKNLKQLLMQPPIWGKVVLGWDPGYRNGCKLAVVDATGRLLDTAVVYPTAPRHQVEQTLEQVAAMVAAHGVDVVALGNGTASRESEQILARLISERCPRLCYVIVNEAGASVYSAGERAAEEFPQLDVSLRSAVSIARRLQDPLAELVKIDPKSIGVGQYQHDMDQKRLGEALGGVVEDCVHAVGVDLNTASAPLLAHVSGIQASLAASIVAYREENGPFTSRAQLRKVPKLGPKAFQQCAGFLRISGGKEPLDATAVHPESYAAAKALLPYAQRGEKLDARALETLAGEWGVGAITLGDIWGALHKPFRDPREDMPQPILCRDVLEMADLQEGMILLGTVRNVVDFGAFVDIGVHQDGLVHLSQISEKFIKHPLDALSVGDVVRVRISSLDMAKGRIGLSMRGLT